MKQIIDGIAQSGDKSRSVMEIYYLIAAVTALTVFSRLLNQWVDYCSGRQRDMLSKVMSQRMMDSVLNADIEMLDNPEYYGKMSAASGDSYMMSDILWHSLDTLSFFISGVGAFAVLCGANWIYGIFVLISAVFMFISSYARLYDNRQKIDLVRGFMNADLQFRC